MQYYIEVTLLPDADMSVNHIWSKVFPQVHLALVEQKTSEGVSLVGLSWPKYRYEKRVKMLGNKLRFFAETKEQLEQLNLISHLSRLLDYVHVRSVDKIPEQVEGYGCFYRLNHDESNEKLARRLVQKKGVSLEKAIRHYENRQPMLLDQPFIQMRSLKSHQTFKLFIHYEKQAEERAGVFNAAYGVTQKTVKTTIPIF